MKNCEQTKGMSVYEHGLSVWEYTQKLLNKDITGFKIPEIVLANYDIILSNVHSVEIIKEYTIFHDCGKPYCLTIGEDGKRHFPNHAIVSKEKWDEIGGDKIVGNLIANDMILHCSSVEEIRNVKISNQDKCTLILVALAELHSNANMFGGIESDSFKIKYKKVSRNIKELYASI